MEFNPFIPNYPDPTPPPPRLYKYVTAERIDILENMRIRYTPLLGTNDIFEVRRTFKELFGTKFRSALHFQMSKSEIEPHVSKMLREKFGLSPEEAVALAPVVLERRFGQEYRTTVALIMQTMTDSTLIPAVNTDEFADKLLNRLGKQILVLSLTEDPGTNPVMWAHYGAQGRGFVIEFNADHLSSDRGKRRPFKVNYCDDSVDEFIDDPNQFFLSKLSCWSYEREWRMFGQESEAEFILEANGEVISLFTIPQDTISSVILGYNMEESLVKQLYGAVSSNFPHASIRRLQADRFSGTFKSETIRSVVAK